MKCPKCETQLELTPQALGESVLTLHLAWDGFVQAKTVAGMIDGTRKLLEAAAKDVGAKAQVFVLAIRQSEKELHVDFLITTTDAKSAKATP